MTIKLGFLASLALLLGACYPASVRVGAGISTGNVIISGQRTNYISSFTPDRAEGGTYQVGEFIRFRLQTIRPGYLTLVAFQDFNSQVILRNYYVNAGTTFIANDGRGNGFQAGYPTGIQYVRAIFTTSDQRNTSSVSLVGRFDSLSGWQNQLNIYIRPFDLPTRDYVDTLLFITR